LKPIVEVVSAGEIKSVIHVLGNEVLIYGGCFEWGSRGIVGSRSESVCLKIGTVLIFLLISRKIFKVKFNHQMALRFFRINANVRHQVALILFKMRLQVDLKGFRLTFLTHLIT
jgi:hypothetical protein